MSSPVLSVLNESSSFLQVTMTKFYKSMSLNFCQIASPTTKLAALERLKNEYNVVSTRAPSFLIGQISLKRQIRRIFTPTFGFVRVLFLLGILIYANFFSADESQTP